MLKAFRIALVVTAALLAAAPAVVAASPPPAAHSSQRRAKDGTSPQPPPPAAAPKIAFDVDVINDGNTPMTRITVRDAASSSGGRRVLATANFSAADGQPSGFAQLRVWTAPEAPRDLQHYAAGFAEGYLTRTTIAQHLANLKEWVGQRTNLTAEVGEWLLTQDEYARAKAAQGAAEGDEFWSAAGAVLAQVDGLRDGYNNGAAAGAATKGAAAAASLLPPMSRVDAMMLSATGDLLDVLPAVSQQKLGRVGSHATDLVADPALAAQMPPALLAEALADRGHCSALVRVNGDLSDILMAHTTWFSFAFMARVYKFYDLAGRRAAFSSYPGALASLDDFYVLSSEGQRLVMLQTTNVRAVVQGRAGEEAGEETGRECYVATDVHLPCSWE
jgi:hypothetical protein